MREGSLPAGDDPFCILPDSFLINENEGYNE